MCHFNVIVLITPKDQMITPKNPDEASDPNLWKRQYALPNDKTARSAKEAVRKMLAPYGLFSRARRPAGVEHCIGWDGYWIGGGWGGQFDPQYDLMSDPRNQRRCTMCRGTGQSGVSRATPGMPDAGPSMPDAKVVCDLCHGTSRCKKPADEWTPVDGDIAPVARLPEKLDAYAVITPNGVWHECGEWCGEILHEPGWKDWKAEVGRLLAQHRDAVAVNVDIHN